MHRREPLRLTREQVRSIDRLAIERYHIPGIVLMENAARSAADVASEMIDIERSSVTIVCGSGNNGGDGLAVARHLHNRGARVALVLAVEPAKFQGDALINWRICQAMELECSPAAEATIPSDALIIDAILGTGLTQAPRGAAAGAIDMINAANRPVLAIDVPSGLDCNTGQAPGACVRADRTITFVAEKTGFAHASARQYLGEVRVGDIGVPRELIQHVLNTTAQ